MDINTFAKLYPNFLKVADDGILEIYADNHMLSTFRKCQGYFYEEQLSHPGKMMQTRGRRWSLEFGQYLHKCMEYFYQAQRDDWEGEFNIIMPPNSPTIKTNQNFVAFLQICSDLWNQYDLEYFMSDEFKVTIGKNAHALGGHDGALRLFTEYYKTHWRQERLRFVGWELSFGRHKEVPIGFLKNAVGVVIARFYYCGRIDLVVDDSDVIGPLDHKSTAYFDGGESDDFKPHDGMQGYVYSVQQMLGEKIREQGKLCNSMIINHISIRPVAKDRPIFERFKRSYKPYTPLEMKLWFDRQYSTFTQIYNLLINDATPTWNTELCNMWYFSSKCPFKKLHELPPANRQGLININYEIKEAWSPYTKENTNGN